MCEYFPAKAEKLEIRWWWWKWWWWWWWWW